MEDNLTSNNPLLHFRSNSEGGIKISGKEREDMRAVNPIVHDSKVIEMNKEEREAVVQGKESMMVWNKSIYKSLGF